MQEDILAASIRVLGREGALRFTTPRVAEAAGISVGSLYQYFPNKQALLFALHSRMVGEVWRDVQGILEGKGSPREKIRRVTRVFFLTESEEVREMGSALQDAEVYFAAQPEHQAVEALVFQRVVRFVRDVTPGRASRARVEFGAELLITVIDSMGRSIASRKLSQRRVERWAKATADMVADFLELPKEVGRT
jgi:AcrR family transcriptional regulator